MLTDTFIDDMLTRHPFFLKQGIGWREDNWERVSVDPQVTEDLTLLYHLRELAAKMGGA